MVLISSGNAIRRTDLLKISQQVFLSRLPECQSVDGKHLFKPLQLRHFSTERKEWNPAFNGPAAFGFKQPVRHQLAHSCWPVIRRTCKEFVPRILPATRDQSTQSVCGNRRTIGVLPHSW